MDRLSKFRRSGSCQRSCQAQLSPRSRVDVRGVRHHRETSRRFSEPIGHLDLHDFEGQLLEHIIDESDCGLLVEAFVDP